MIVHHAHVDRYRYGSGGNAHTDWHVLDRAILHAYRRIALYKNRVLAYLIGRGRKV